MVVGVLGEGGGGRLAEMLEVDALSVQDGQQCDRLDTEGVFDQGGADASG